MQLNNIAKQAQTLRRSAEKGGYEKLNPFLNRIVVEDLLFLPPQRCSRRKTAQTRLVPLTETGGVGDQGQGLGQVLRGRATLDIVALPLREKKERHQALRFWGERGELG